MVQKVCSMGKKYSTSAAALCGPSEPCKGLISLPSTANCSRMLDKEGNQSGEGMGEQKGEGSLSTLSVCMCMCMKDKGCTSYLSAGFFSSSSSSSSSEGAEVSIFLHSATASSLARHSASMGPLHGHHDQSHIQHADSSLYEC